MSTFHCFQFDPATGAPQPVSGDAHAPFTGAQAAAWNPNDGAGREADPHDDGFSAGLHEVGPTAPNIVAGPLIRSHGDWDGDDGYSDDDGHGDGDGGDDVDDDCNARGLRTGGRPPYLMGRSIHGGGPGPFSRSKGLQ